MHEGSGTEKSHRNKLEKPRRDTACSAVWFQTRTCKKPTSEGAVCRRRVHGGQINVERRMIKTLRSCLGRRGGDGGDVCRENRGPQEKGTITEEGRISETSVDWVLQAKVDNSTEKSEWARGRHGGGDE